MDPRFHPAVEAMKAGDLERFRTLLREDSSLATAPWRRGGSLLQCVVVDGYGQPHSIERAKLLIEAGAPVDEPLIAAASMDNLEAVHLLLDAGAAINGNGTWSPIEDALAFGMDRIVRLPLERAAPSTISALRPGSAALA